MQARRRKYVLSQRATLCNSSARFEIPLESHGILKRREEIPSANRSSLSRIYIRLIAKRVGGDQQSLHRDENKVSLLVFSCLTRKRTTNGANSGRHCHGNYPPPMAKIRDTKGVVPRSALGARPTARKTRTFARLQVHFSSNRIERCNRA